MTTARRAFGLWMLARVGASTAHYSGFFSAESLEDYSVFNGLLSRSWK